MSHTQISFMSALVNHLQKLTRDFDEKQPFLLFVVKLCQRNSNWALHFPPARSWRHHFQLRYQKCSRHRLLQDQPLGRRPRWYRRSAPRVPMTENGKRSSARILFGRFSKKINSRNASIWLFLLQSDELLSYVSSEPHEDTFKNPNEGR